MNMMTNIQIGSLVLNTELLIYLAAGIVAVFALRLRSRKNPNKEKIVSIGWSAIILWIAVWKGSLLLIDPMSVIREPLSLLFFSGGVWGFWLATVTAVGWCWYKYKRIVGQLESLQWTGVLLSWWVTAYLLAVIVIGESVQLLQCVGLLLSLGVGIVLLHPSLWSRMKGKFGDGGLRSPRVLTQGAVFLLVLVLLSYTFYDQLQNGVLSKQRLGSAEGSSIVGPREGNIAPGFELVDWKGERVSLKDYRGQTVMINFWTTWCKVCKTEMPHVQKLYEHYQATESDVAILTLNVTSQELNATHVKQYIEKQGFEFPVVLDARGDAESEYDVRAYPTTFIVGDEGVIRERFLGAISYNDMKKRIERVRKSEAE
ncbi:redoxin domain-containing protein [Paenibacillus sp. GSMTC-2017]|uniref:TlpA family protein disulfide reductase n=1 Tax=Paenibacillus sp. GSMTC-2017 TaxID=2794350 RepID=UPI0018D813A8|nr:redoxin domain-containing protein [Paenibacillus sp. GSMTC-2017]MBH5319716.1 redoxin domain-containing protein [Paenibacillus sp. GSMTC-2017]